MTPADRDAVKTELNRLLSSVLYTEKAHFRHEERARRTYFWLGLVATAAGTLTAISVLQDLATWIPTVLAVLASLCSALLTFVRPSDSAEAHAKSGRSLGELRVRMRQYRDLDLRDADVTVQAARACLAKFAADKADIDAVAEAISDRVYRRTAKKLKDEGQQ
ncbi:SLATT domain-containing protein [Knoellia sp. LjRoot47]|uniref:SLATT domain-containing protein n=1 Tax=Knoellia sp. LjRoot47 TaxID=3342330 RepID=UPI003F5022F4